MPGHADEVFYTNGPTKAWSGPPSFIDDIEWFEGIVEYAKETKNYALEIAFKRAIETRKAFLAGRHALCKQRWAESLRRYTRPRRF